MAKQIMEFEQKYDIGTEVICLVSKNIKEGYVFPDTEGEVTSFNNKTNTYKVSIKLINGENTEAEYKEKEIILKNLDVEDSNETVEEAKKRIKKLRVRQKVIFGLFTGAILLLVIAALLVAFLIEKEKLRNILLIVCLALILINGLLAFLSLRPVGNEIILNSRKIEAVALAEYKKSTEDKKKKDKVQYDDLLIQIQRLKGMLDQNIITESEYEDAKKKLLKKL